MRASIPAVLTLCVVVVVILLMVVVLLFFGFFSNGVVGFFLFLEAVVVGVVGEDGTMEGRLEMLFLSCDQHGMELVLGSKMELGVVGVGWFFCCANTTKLVPGEIGDVGVTTGENCVIRCGGRINAGGGVLGVPSLDPLGVFLLFLITEEEDLPGLFDVGGDAPEVASTAPPTLRQSGHRYDFCFLHSCPFCSSHFWCTHREHLSQPIQGFVWSSASDSR